MSPLEPVINPVKFHSNCMGVVQTSFCDSFTSVENYKKNAFFSKGHNSARNHSIKKPVKYAQGLEAVTNPLKFHSNCIITLITLGGVVQINFKI